MILQAAREWNLDLSQSYMIGDSTNDIMAGESAGIKMNFLIEQNRGNALLDCINNFLCTG